MTFCTFGQYFLLVFRKFRVEFINKDTITVKGESPDGMVNKIGCGLITYQPTGMKGRTMDLRNFHKNWEKLTENYQVLVEFCRESKLHLNIEKPMCTEKA